MIQPASPDVAARLSRAWTAERLGRLGSGGFVLVCAALSLSDTLVPARYGLALLAFAGFQLMLSALVGRCPIHRMMKALGVRDREEVYAEALGLPPTGAASEPGR